MSRIKRGIQIILLLVLFIGAINLGIACMWHLHLYAHHRMEQRQSSWATSFGE